MSFFLIVSVLQTIIAIMEEGDKFMYVVKVLHGYITTDGKRTRDKKIAKRYKSKETAEKFAHLIGGRVKKLN